MPNHRYDYKKKELPKHNNGSHQISNIPKCSKNIRNATPKHKNSTPGNTHTITKYDTPSHLRNMRPKHSNDTYQLSNIPKYSKNVKNATPKH